MPKRAEPRKVLGVVRLNANQPILILHIEGRKAVQVNDTQVIWETNDSQDDVLAVVREKRDKSDPISQVKVCGPKKKIEKLLSGIGSITP